MEKVLRSKNGFTPLIILGVVAILLLILFGGYFFLKSKQQINIPGFKTPKESFQNKSLIVLDSKGGNKIYSIDLSTNQRREILRDDNIDINEAQVSPDGQKLYYIPFPSNFLESPRKVVIFNNQNEKKEFDLARSDNWPLLGDLGNLGVNSFKNCFWSPDGDKLACLLIEREKTPSGIGIGQATGRDKVVVLDLTSGNIFDVFNSDQVEPPQGPIIFLSTFAGWVRNDKLLLLWHPNVQTKENPADFYTIDIKTKTVKKELSYPHNLGSKIAISPKDDEIFFQSFSKIKEDKFVKYDMNSKQDTTLASTPDVLGTTHFNKPVISEDGSKVIFTTIAFLVTPPIEKNIEPWTLEDTTRTEIHVYDLATNQESIVKTPEPIGFVETLLSDNKTFIVNKTAKGSILFNSETGSFEELNGLFLGLGNF